jgi:uncharacterized membrane protein YhhN
MLIFLVLAFVFAALEWTSEYKKFKLGIYLTKPTVMLCLIAWVWTYSDLPVMITNFYTFSLLWFVVGLVFCLIGDVFLMLPPERFFVPGLITFLIGHIFYILGFDRILPPEGTWLPAAILVLMLLGVLVTVYQRLARGLDESGKSKMKRPILVYALVISMMLYGALMTLLDDVWLFTPSLWVSAGALLFYVSDIMNAWTRFVAPISNDRFKIMTTYHLGQIAISIGATLHFVSFVR